MNISALGGLIAVNVVFFTSVLLALGNLSTFYDGPSVLIVFGGTISALFIFIPMKDMKIMLVHLRVKFLRRVHSTMHSLLKTSSL